MITLWGRRNSMNVQKVVWTLEELGVAYERHNAAGSYGGTNTPGFKTMNPMGLVPVLRDGDTTMFESNAIVRYLAARYGEGNLRPREPGALAKAEQWMDWAQINIGPPMMALFFQSVRTAPDNRNKEVSLQVTEQLRKLLPVADAALAGSPFLAGEKLSFGDVPLGAMIWRLSCFDWQWPALPNIGRWHEALKARPAYQKGVMIPTGKTPEDWLAIEKQYA
ncbi:MAG: glutathione S-transferase family protein [Aestuariivirgaceae bacterium]